MDKNSYILHCGKLYDGIRPELQPDREILVEGNIITEVASHVHRPQGAEIIDLSHLTVTPGLIDAHIHSSLMEWKDLYQTPLLSDSYKQLANLHTAQRCLERGFTTIRCHVMGQWDYGIVDVKRAIDRDIFPGSRLNVAAHMLGTPGCHFDLGAFHPLNPQASQAITPNYIGNGVDFFRGWVRNEVKFGSDFIKFCMSGGFASLNDGPEDQQMSDEEVQAIIDTARGMDIPTTAHVYSPTLMQKLIRFGITGMEHGSLMDEETARLFEETGTYLVPTFCPYNEVINVDEEALSKKAPEFQAKLRKYAKQLQEGREIIAASKIRLGYGTDFVTVHECYESWYEYQSWMRAGMDPFRILHAATMVNAGILRLDSRLGSVEPGKLADISGWGRDLLNDEDALSECSFVMKNGRLYPTGQHFLRFY